MTLYEFKQRPTIEQAHLAWEKGVHLTTRFHGMQAILLWQIDGFYVEIFYNRLDNEIEKVRSFNSTLPLGPYLNLIDITPVLHYT